MGRKGSGASSQGLVSEVNETAAVKMTGQKTGWQNTEPESAAVLSDYHERSKHDRRLNWRQACYVLHCGRTKFFDLIASGVLQWEGVGVRGHYVWESDCLKLLCMPTL